MAKGTNTLGLRRALLRASSQGFEPAVLSEGTEIGQQGFRCTKGLLNTKARAFIIVVRCCYLDSGAGTAVEHSRLSSVHFCRSLSAYFAAHLLPPHDVPRSAFRPPLP